MKIYSGIIALLVVVDNSSASLVGMSRLPALPSKRLSRGHNYSPAVSEGLVATVSRSREAGSQVFNTWLLSTASIASDVSIGQLMQSCEQYALVAGVHNIDDSFQSKPGFSRRLRAAPLALSGRSGACTCAPATRKS